MNQQKIYFDFRMREERASASSLYPGGQAIDVVDPRIYSMLYTYVL
jgi:hypothetical protein